MNTEKVGKAISYLRKRAGYTQKELADRIGISDKAVSKWERGISLPDISLLGKLSILLDTDAESLLAGSIIPHDEKWGGILKIDESPYGIYAGTMIFDKPLVYFLLGNFMLVGIKDIRIECDERSREFIERELGDGAKYGIHITFDEELVEHSNYMIINGRSILYGIDQTRLFQRAMVHTNRVIVLSIPKGMGDGQGLKFDSDKRIVGENNVETQYSYYKMPIFFCPKDKMNVVNGIMSDDNIYTEVAPRGFVELPINTWEDVAEASGFIKTIQKSCGMELFCLEEIAWRRGMITTEELIGFGNRGNPHGEYILNLIQQVN